MAEPTINIADLTKIADLPAPSQNGPVSELWHGLIVGFDPSGNEVTRQVQVSNPSRSWVQKKLEETAALLQRANGFRWFNSSSGQSDVITLLHPTLNCLSFELTVVRCPKAVSDPPCTGDCVKKGA